MRRMVVIEVLGDKIAKKKKTLSLESPASCYSSDHSQYEVTVSKSTRHHVYNLIPIPSPWLYTLIRAVCHHHWKFTLRMSILRITKHLLQNTHNLLISHSVRSQTPQQPQTWSVIFFLASENRAFNFKRLQWLIMLGGWSINRYCRVERMHIIK